MTILITLYLSAIIAANLLVVQFGPAISIVNAFVFIGLDLTTRDYLHERWQRRHLWPKMLLLIAAGSLLSWFLNRNAGPIALASFAAFAGAGVADALVYTVLGKKSRFLKINGSNVVSSAVDSLLFPMLAFGFPLLWLIVLGQFVAKVGGGFVWSLVLVRFSNAADLGEAVGGGVMDLMAFFVGVFFMMVFVTLGAMVAIALIRG